MPKSTASKRKRAGGHAPGPPCSPVCPAINCPSACPSASQAPRPAIGSFVRLDLIVGEDDAAFAAIVLVHHHHVIARPARSGDDAAQDHPLVTWLIAAHAVAAGDAHAVS